MNSRCCEDRHLPAVVMDNFIRRLISPPKRKISKFIRTGTTSADIGCGPGYFTIPMAELAGSTGKVYAVDSDPKSIETLKAKSSARGLEKIIETYTASAANMTGVPDQSADFVFANGVLCCMTDHEGAVEEIKRILKPNCLTYLSVTRLFRKSDRRAVPKEEWNRILAQFTVKERGEGILNRWAVASKALANTVSPSRPG